MSRDKAPTKATGGGGYTFADKVAAGFLAQMLKRIFPIEPEFGRITELHFEARESGQILDDLVLVLAHGNATTRCPISVKSNRQLTKKGFNEEFVRDAWEQWNGNGHSFNRETDLLGLIVGVIDAATLEEWRGLQKQAFASTPERRVQRLADSQQSSGVQQAIFESLRREQNGVKPDLLETARLASRTRVLPFPEGDEGKYVNLCAEIVLDGTMRWPEELEAKAKQGQDDRELKMLSLTLSSAARSCLSGRKALLPAEVPEFARQTRRLGDWHPSDLDALQEQYRVNSLAGGIAVLIIQHRAWLGQNPEIEKWCLDTLRKLKPAEGSDFDSSMSALDHTAESFLGEAAVALLLESNEQWILRLAFEGVTGFYYNSTFQTMVRAYLLREQLGEKFGELTNTVVLWSALRRAANRESGYEAKRDLLAKYKATLFRRYLAGRLKGQLLPLTKAVTLGNRLVERVSRRTMSPGERRMREARREWVREHGRDRKLDRDIPTLDFQVLQKGFGFLWAMVREPLPTDKPILRHYINDLFAMEMRTLPTPGPGEENYEIEGTPYEFDVWVLARVAEFIVKENSVEVARTFYRPILDLDSAGRYWVEDFLQTWVRTGLEMTLDPHTFAKIWTDMVDYAMALPAWQPSARGYWSRAESLAVDLVGMHNDAAAVLGQPKHKAVVQAMVPVFERWASAWLNHASVAGWFAHFLTTESGEVLLAMGITELAKVVGSFEDRDWHQQGLGGILTDALAACWRVLPNEIEWRPDLRKAFLDILTVLCAREVPEAVHLRNRVSEAVGAQAQSQKLS